MSFDTAKKSADFLMNNALKHGVKELSWKFFGGEPLLNLNVLIKFYDYVVAKGKELNIKMFFGIITNGTIYNEKFEKFIVEFCKSGNVINFSIDGAPEVQDKNRITVNGGPTSKIVSENILKLKKLLEDNNINLDCLNTHSVITKNNISNIFSSYKYFKQLGLNNNRFVLSYDEDWNQNDISIYIEQLSLISDFVYEECISSGSLIPYEMAYIINDHKPVSSVKVTCEAAKSMCAIIPNGDIYPCQRSYSYDASLKLGNVFEGAIDNNMRKLFFDTYRCDMHVNSDSCSKCDNTDCKICMLSNYGERGDMLKCNPVSCTIHKAKWDFLIKTKKKFYKLFSQSKYNNCSQMMFVKATNE